MTWWRTVSGLGGLIGVCLTVPASADGGKPENDVATAAMPGRFDFKRPRHDVQLAFGTGALVGLSAMEEGHGDVSSGGMLPAGVGPSVAVRHQWPSAWSAGVRGVGMFADDRLSLMSGNALWQLAAEGRWQPEGELGPYAELGVGTMLAIHRYGNASGWQWAPLVDGAIGFDVGLVGPLALGFELRGALTLFSADGESFEANDELVYYAYGVTPWIGLSAIVSLGI